MEIFIEDNLNGAARALVDKHLRQIPFAASLALNQTAFRIAKKRLPRETQRRFEGGSVPWTKRGFNYTRANKRKLAATVFTRESHAYLALQIHGGVRRPPPGGRAMILPSKHSRRTKEGNVSRKMRRNYLNRAENARVNSGGKKSASSHQGAFIGRPRGRVGSPYGIWQRSRQGLKLLLEMDRKSIRYKKRFRFYKYGKDEFHRYFDNELAVALQRAID